MRKKRNLMILSILFLAIGFAAVTTTLVINGTLKIGTNQNDFDKNVIFTRAETDAESKASISADGKSINFASRELKNIYEEAVLDFDVTNKSRQYGVTATIECTKVDEENSFNEYISIDIEPEEFSLGINETMTGKLTTTMIRSFIGTSSSDTAEIEIKCTINANAIEVDTKDDDTYVPTPTYKNTISGYLVDENNNILANKNLVIISNNETFFVTTDENGYYEVSNLPDGDYEIYIVDGKTMDEIKKMTIDEIKNQASIKGTYSTDDNELTFDNGVKTSKNEPKQITFDTTGLDASIPPINVVEGEAYGTLPSPNKPGYTFEGWYLGDEPILPSTIVNLKEGQTLTPKFNVENYTISYNLNGGTNNTGNPSSYNITSDTITLAEPTKTGHTFTGWTGSNGGTAQKLVTIPKGSTGNKSYTANWSVNSYNVTATVYFRSDTSGEYASYPSSTTINYGENSMLSLRASYPYRGKYNMTITSGICSNGYTYSSPQSTTGLISNGTIGNVFGVIIYNNNSANNTECTFYADIT